jgi:hypothetical protein
MEFVNISIKTRIKSDVVGMMHLFYFIMPSVSQTTHSATCISCFLV